MKESPQPKRLSQFCCGHSSSILSLAIVDEKQMLVTGNGDVRLCDIDSGECLKVDEDCGAVDVLFSHSSNKVIGGQHDKITIWDFRAMPC